MGDSAPEDDSGSEHDGQDANAGPAPETLTLGDIARALGLEAAGDTSLPVCAIAEPAMAGPDDLALAVDRRFADALAGGQARMAVLWEGADWRALGLDAAIFCTRIGAVLPGLTGMMDPGPGFEPGIHPSAVIAPDAEIGPDAWIGAFSVIGRGACIGPGARIAPHVTIGAGARLGAQALLHAGVRIGRGVRIGSGFIAQPGAVIGGDGFSFKTREAASAVETLRADLARGSHAESSRVEGSRGWARVASLGGVEIGDNVEIGSNSTVDRGTIRATRIGSGTKIDNLVQVGHNVVIGQDCMISAGTGIAGSARLGDRVVLGGMCGVRDNITIGDDVIAGGRTTVFSNVPAGRAIWGSPAVRLETQIAINKAMRRLPRLEARLRDALAQLSRGDADD